MYLFGLFFVTAGVVFLVILVLLILIFLVTFAYGAMSAAPWVPVLEKDVERLLKIAKLQPNDVIYDLGCGDARILIQGAKKYGTSGVGYEIALMPYLVAQARISLAGLRGKVKVHWKSFWHEPIGSADVVYCYLMPRALVKLQNKFQTELNSNTRVVSYAFRLHWLTPTETERPDLKQLPVYLYTKIVQSKS